MTEEKNPQNIGACAVLYNSEGKILLGKRKNSYKAGLYGLPGGRIELNEPIFEAVQREVAEETGLNDLLFSFEGVVRENQGEYDFIHFVFASNVIGSKPELIEPEKCEVWEWINPTSLPEDLLPGHAAAIELVTKNKDIVDITF